MALTRRNFIRLAGTGAATAALAGVAVTPAWAADEYDTLRTRWAGIMAGTGFDPAQEPFAGRLAKQGELAAGYWPSMAPSASSLWPDLPFGTVSANVTASFVRLRAMAFAYAWPGTGLTGDSDLAADIVTGLDHLIATAYTVAGTTYNNWWDWQIGSPFALLDTITVVYDKLSAAQINSYVTALDQYVTPAKLAVQTGANRVDVCRVIILRGILGKNSAKIALGCDELAPMFPYVRSSDGFYRDGSFIQHLSVPYTGTYGAVLIEGLGRLLALLADSTWEITDPNRQVIFDSVEKSFAPFLFNGLMMDGQSGRGIVGGPSASDHNHGQSIISSILLLANAASDAEAARWRGMAKGWLQRDTYSPPLANPNATTPSLARFKAVLDAPSISPIAEPVESRVFGSMDRAVHRRPGWAFAVSMCSGRTAFYEGAINTSGENLRGWHTNSGMTYWWGDTYGNGQYSDAYWPTVDPYRLPGTTVSRKTLADAAGGGWPPVKPSADVIWVGGATDGEFSAVGQQVQGVQSTLTGRKSWFCLGNSVVCLGAGIAASDGAAVETTVDNRSLGADGWHELTVDGRRQSGSLGWSDTFDGARWAAIKGFGGYIFPGGAALNAKREERTGSWRDINGSGVTDPLTRRYLTLWLDHGVDPTSGAYSYILMPGASAAVTAIRAARPTITVLANTGAVQAVSDSATGVTAANFYAAGSAGPITVDRPCSVLVREHRGTLSVSVADPTRDATTVTVTIKRKGFCAATGDPQVNVIGSDPIKLLVETGGSQGASRTITFGTGKKITAGHGTQLPVTDDSFVRDGSYAATNYGNATLIEVKNGDSGYNRRSLTKFDLSSLSAAPRRAVLWVNGHVSDSKGTQAALTAYGVNDDNWTESTVTWTNQPALGQELSSEPVCDVYDWIPLDVTAFVQAQYAGDKTATIGLAQSAGGPGMYLRGRSSSTSPSFLQVVTE